MTDRKEKNKVLFVTGTDTEVGKTYISGLLLRFLKEKGIVAGYQKWVSTGDSDSAADLIHTLATAEIPFDPEQLDEQVPYRFELPASPHLAAEQENRQVDPEVIVKSCRELSAKYEMLIVEGVGGLFVPLRRDLLLADLLANLHLQTLVVARSGLGTLNHTLLTLEALRKRDIPVFGVVFTDTEKAENELIVQDNMRTVAEIGNVRVFGRVPWCETVGSANKAFQPIGEKILKVLSEE